MADQCPNCQSFKTYNKRSTYIWGGLVFALLSIPWMFVLIGIPFFIAGLVIFLAGFRVSKEAPLSCRNCEMEFARPETSH